MTKLSQKGYDEVFARNVFRFYIFFQIYMLVVKIVRFCLVWSNGQDSLALMFDVYDIPYYAINYDNGFIIRGLAGELFGDIVLGMKTDILVWSNIAKIIYSAIFVGILTFCLFKFDDINLKTLGAIMFIRPLYIANSTLYTMKPDIFWYLSLVPIIFLLWKDKTKYFNIKMIFVILLSIFAMLFHQAFIFVFAPLVCLILIDKKSKGWFMTYGFILCITFVLMLKFGQADYDSLCQTVTDSLKEAELWDIIIESDMTLVDDGGYLPGLYYEYKLSRFDQMFQCQDLLELYFRYHVPVCFFDLLLCIPSLITTYKVLKKYCSDVLINPLLVQLFTSVVILPFVALVFFTIDIDRWSLMTLTYLNIFAIYVVHKHKLDVTYDNKKILKVSMIALILLYPLFTLIGFI